MLASILLALLSFTLSLPLLVCLTIENQDQTIEDQDQPIFLSIDCGIPKDGNYTDGMTTIDYVSDASFIDSGVGTTHNISATFKTDSLAQQYFILRSFPDGTKNCYKLPTGETGAESIIRASFMYGNYDGLNKLPQFEIQLGVETWDTVQFADANSSVRKEIIFSPVSNITYLCLVNTGLGTPFISAIEIRSSMVRGYGTSSLAALSLFQRWNFGDITVNNIIRFPDDKLDRIWSALALPPGTEILNNTLVVPLYLVGGPITNPPVSVLKTAVTPLNLTDPIRYSWEVSNPTSQLQIYSYFSELLYLQPNQTREMDVLVNGISNNPFTTAVWPQTTSVLSRTPGNADSVDFRVARTSKSTLPPLLNAMEIYILRQFSHLPTAQNEVDAMNNIKTSLSGKKLDWQGDPCLPQGYAWSGLTCGYNGTQSPQITSLNLSATGLTGGNQSYTYMGELKSLQILDLSNNSLKGIIPEFLAELLALELLDLSNNSLDGTIPNFLAQLPSLKFLSLKGNKFTGLVPDELMRRSANGSITLRVDDNNCPSCNRKNNKSGSMVIPAVAASIGGSLLITLLIFSIWSVIKKPRADKRVRGLFEGMENEDDLELPLFSLTTIVEATDNFSVEKKLGQGGFGSVYKGVIGDEKEIAVKRLSISSSQGQDEFKNEAILIAKLQHRNLVKLIGCCLEGVEKMLVYEYMPNKSLDYFIFDQIQGKLIDWPRRFWIIHGIARGLLYLHQDSRLTIIHRDLKASNILLDSKMNPKISDFGMAKTFGGEQIEGNTTRVAGTYGYMAPEYASDGLFSMKSDVFSFGVLLLEIVSGKKNRALYRGKQSSVNLVGYAWTLWSDRRAMELLDVVLADSCSLAEVVRCIHIGLLCVEQHPEDRPTMSSIVQMLDSDKELPQPKHPAFFSNRDRPEASNTTAADNTESFSINEASLSDLRGR